MQQFKPVIEAVTAGCKGDAWVREMVEGRFDSFRKDNWQIVDAIQCIWNGERDADALTADIDYNSRAIVLAILAVLNGENPFEGIPNQQPQPAPPEQVQDQEEEQGMSLDKLIQMAVSANDPNMPTQIKDQIAQMADSMAANDEPVMQTLGRIIKEILNGSTTPDLTDLPDEMANAVKETLQKS